MRAVELAGEVVEELAKVGQADGVVAQQLCSQFLQTIKARLCQAISYLRLCCAQLPIPGLNRTEPVSGLLNGFCMVAGGSGGAGGSRAALCQPRAAEEQLVPRACAGRARFALYGALTDLQVLVVSTQT